VTDPPIDRRWSWIAARRIVLIGGSAVLALAAVDGCSESSTATAPKTNAVSSMAGMAGMAVPATSSVSQGMPTLHIENFTFVVPATVKPGQLIAVMNMDGEAHTVTADDGGFTVQAPAGQTVMLTAPSKPGSYPFHCAYHANMHGVLVVR